MSRLDRFLAGALWCLAVLCVAGIVHILAIFNFTKLDGKTPLTRLEPLIKPGELSLLPRALPAAEWTPFLDPALAQGACVFDVTHAPVRVSGEIDSARMLTLSFRTPTGGVFYSMTGRAAQGGRIDVLILTEDQLERLETQDDEDAPQELRLVAPTKTGFVLVNALVAFPSERQAAETRIKAISCAPEPLGG